MTTATSPAHGRELREARKQAEGTLVDFDQDALRDTLICSAGVKLSQVATSSTAAMKQQLQTIRQSVADFDLILDGMKTVDSNVQRINTNVGTVVNAARQSSEELKQVSERMEVLEKNFAAIRNLVSDVNQIADQT
ncbi:MAG: hypothetical protein KDA96_20100 [Planctomycetaceae bacterium]|nr:hypothetical protein [Planctomycetaceae bacterium]